MVLSAVQKRVRAEIYKFLAVALAASRCAGCSSTVEGPPRLSVQSCTLSPANGNHVRVEGTFKNLGGTVKGVKIVVSGDVFKYALLGLPSTEGSEVCTRNAMVPFMHSDVLHPSFVGTGTGTMEATLPDLVSTGDEIAVCLDMAKENEGAGAMEMTIYPLNGTSGSAKGVVTMSAHPAVGAAPVAGKSGAAVKAKDFDVDAFNNSVLYQRDGAGYPVRDAQRPEGSQKIMEQNVKSQYGQ